MEAYFVVTNEEVLIWRDHYPSLQDAEQFAEVLRRRFNRPVSIVLGDNPNLNLPPLPWDEEISTSYPFNYPV